MTKLFIASNDSEALQLLLYLRKAEDANDFEICVFDQKSFDILVKSFPRRIKIHHLIIAEYTNEAQHLTSVIYSISALIQKNTYDKIFVCDDSLMAFGSALAGFYKKIPIHRIVIKASSTDHTHTHLSMISTLTTQHYVLTAGSLEQVNKPNFKYSLKGNSAQKHAFKTRLRQHGKLNVLIVIGTRPEVIKMAPIIPQLLHDRRVRLKICLTGQHNEMVNNILKFFLINPDYNLEIMREKQTLDHIAGEVLLKINQILQADKIDYVFVQGDTSTAFATALAAFYNHIPVAHVEAGLRTGNIYSPFPEEVNRMLIGNLARLHFAPTLTQANNLLTEGIDPDRVFITGNTVIDSLYNTLKFLDSHSDITQLYRDKFKFLDPTKKIILVTAHRRENFGQGFENVCQALLDIADQDDVQIIYPVHLNPNIKMTAESLLSNTPNIYLIELPLDYVAFVYLLKQAFLVITDSGGIQEETPGLMPIVVIRENTERPEAVAVGAAKLVGTDRTQIVKTVRSILNDPVLYQQMVRIKNPYGDGTAAKQIVKHFATATTLKSPTYHPHTGKAPIPPRQTSAAVRPIPWTSYVGNVAVTVWNRIVGTAHWAIGTNTKAHQPSALEVEPTQFAGKPNSKTQNADGCKSDSSTITVDISFEQLTTHPVNTIAVQAGAVWLGVKVIRNTFGSDTEDCDNEDEDEKEIEKYCKNPYAKIYFEQLYPALIKEDLLASGYIARVLLKLNTHDLLLFARLHLNPNLVKEALADLPDDLRRTILDFIPDAYKISCNKKLILAMLGSTLITPEMAAGSAGIASMLDSKQSPPTKTEQLVGSQSVTQLCNPKNPLAHKRLFSANGANSENKKFSIQRKITGWNTTEESSFTMAPRFTRH